MDAEVEKCGRREIWLEVCRFRLCSEDMIEAMGKIRLFMEYKEEHSEGRVSRTIDPSVWEGEWGDS